MSRSKLVYPFVLGAVLSMISLGGCGKTEEEKKAEEEALSATIAPVTDQEARDAREAVKTARSGVLDKVRETYKPSREDLPFYLDLAVLTRHPHRLAGYGSLETDSPGSLSPSRYVENRLKGMGLKEVATQDFPVIQPVTTECELIADGKSYPMYATRPNILQAPITPAEGLTGLTLYVGDGATQRYGRNPAENRIVVMDFDCGKNWLNAFAFGAKAVLFVEGDEPAANTYHHVNVPANLPRFYVTKDVAEQLELTKRPREVKLLAACEWRQLQGRNVIAVIRGTAPKFSEDRPNQAVVLAAPLDALSEVPLLSPGARNAANCAALLKIAEYLKENPPKRDVIICFFDAQSQHHIGARYFYGSINRRLSRRKIADDTIEDRLERLEEERKFCHDLGAIIDKTAPLAELCGRWAKLDAERTDLLKQKDYSPSEKERLDREIALLEAEMDSPDMVRRGLFGPEMRGMPRHPRAVKFLREEAKNFDSDILDKLKPLRVINTEKRQLRDELRDKVESLEKRIASNEANEEPRADLEKSLDSASTRLAALESELTKQLAEIKILEERDLGWNSVIRDLFEENLSTETRGRFARLVTEGREVLDRRLKELDELTAQMNTAMVLRNTIGPEHNAIVLHVSVNLGDARKKWTFIHGDNSAPLNEDRSGNYSGIFRAMRNIRKDNPEILADFDANAVSESYDNRMFAPGLYADSSAVAGIFAFFNVSVMTSMDRRPRDGQPSDTLEALDVENVRNQLVQVAPALKLLADSRGLDIPPSIRAEARIMEGGWSSNKATGPSVKQAGAGSAMPNRAVRDAIVALVRYHPKGVWNGGIIEETPPGFVFPLIVKTDTNGIIEVPAYSQHKYNYQQPRAFAALFDRTPVGTDEIPKEYTTRGLITSVTASKKLKVSRGQFNKWAVDLFKASSKTVVGYGYNRGAIQTTAMRARSTAKFRTDRSLICEIENILTIYAPVTAKGMKLFCKTGPVLLNNAPTKDRYQGEGVSLDDPFEHPVMMRRAAHDLMVLNTQRLTTLRGSRIVQPSLAALNGEATDLYNDAEAQLVSGEGETGQLSASLDEQLAGYESSSAISRRGYNPLKGVMNDLVTAVVLLLLLAMPFAYALERLLIGTPHIYRQIGWFAFFFLITFAVLFMVNPAFQIAATPVIIFLAFTIILLSALVIFIMVRKLQAEIKKMQGLSTTVHSADVSRLSTMSAAVNMGISTMRRRPVRTFLTAVTVLLLTFTILTFASFGSSWGIRETYEGPITGMPPRILIRQQLWSPIGDGVYETLRGHMSQDATVVPRYWVSPTAQHAKDILKNERMPMDFLVASPGLGKISPIAAAIGLDVRDLEMQAHLKELFTESASEPDKIEAIMDTLSGEDWIVITDAQRKELALRERDVGKARLILAGLPLTYAGTVSDMMASFALLDGSSMLPVDYQASGGSSVDTFAEESSTESLSEQPDIESAQFVTYNMDQVVIVSAKTARVMNGKIRSITIYPKNEEDVAAMGRRAAKISELPAYAGGSDGVSRMIFTSLAEASGTKDLLIPVLLGGLIIFATMLGSVSDREREIYTFSSLGLAPAHVAGLFFAEASVYAVVGGMGGYLLGQIVARVLGYAAGLGWVSVPTMNYSSTNAIVTVLIVMGTVLISTIYPAMKASRSANPGIQRSWRIPSPEGNLYDLIFPFTVSAYDIVGVVSFLKEHFDNYSDTSLGVFTSMECSVFRQKANDMLGFRASVALAPFDLGVTQKFALLSQPSDIEGIDEVRILIYRLSGAQGDWQRSNRVFVNELRKQLLIWRSLTQDIMDKYRQNTLEAWDNLPVEQVDPQSVGGSV